MSKTVSFVWGCNVFGKRPDGTKPEEICITKPEIPSHCVYCYACLKMFPTRGLSEKEFHSPVYYREKLINEVQKIKTPDIYTGSIMGDFLSPDITNDMLVDIFTILENSPQHLIMLLSKNAPRYVDFVKNVWRRDLPKNVWCGTSIENQYYAKRANFLRELKELSPSTHIWVESEPTIGYHTNTDFSHVDHVTCSLLGEDQIYTSQQGTKFSSYFKEDWILSLLHNPTLDNSKFSIWEGVTRKCKSPEILQHKNHNMYEELHKLNGRYKKTQEECSPLW